MAKEEKKREKPKIDTTRPTRNETKDSKNRDKGNK